MNAPQLSEAELDVSELLAREFEVTQGNVEATGLRLLARQIFEQRRTNELLEALLDDVQGIGRERCTNLRGG